MRPGILRKRGSAVAATVLMLFMSPAPADLPPHAASPATMLARADRLKTSEHSRFLGLLKKLHRLHDRLTAPQREKLRYLDAWQAAYAGDYPRANRMLDTLVKHAGDRSISARAKALLVHDKFVARHYEQAYVMAESLVQELPSITDPMARMSVLSQVIQMLNRGDQYDLALKYAHRMQHEFPSGSGKCLADMLETKTRMYQGNLDPSDPAFRKTIDTCHDAGKPVYADSLILDWADMMNTEGHPAKAIALLHRTAPAILRAGYRFHIASLHVILARAYLRKGDPTNAQVEALKTLALSNPEDFNWNLQDAYQVLYQVARMAGHDDKALAYHEKYLAQYKAATKDAQARTLAYQMVRQNVLAKKMEVEKLARENKILQLRQSLARKKAETNRLYLLVLFLVIVLLAFWAWRIKHSQMRFRRMAQHDGLTGCLNRGHFLELSTQCLQRLRKTRTHACLLILDMDHFKRINDSHGHLNGDRVLQHVAATCRKELRTSDLFGRLGGEEFGLLLPDCSCAQGNEVGRRICRALANTSVILDGGVRIRMTASIGLACTDRTGRDLRKLIAHADQALYGAKRGGRNRLSMHGNLSATRPEQDAPA